MYFIISISFKSSVLFRNLTIGSINKSYNNNLINIDNSEKINFNDILEIIELKFSKFLLFHLKELFEVFIYFVIHITFIYFVICSYYK